MLNLDFTFKNLKQGSVSLGFFSQKLWKFKLIPIKLLENWNKNSRILESLVFIFPILNASIRVRWLWLSRNLYFSIWCDFKLLLEKSQNCSLKVQDMRTCERVNIPCKKCLPNEPDLLISITAQYIRVKDLLCICVQHARTLAGWSRSQKCLFVMNNTELKRCAQMVQCFS